MTLKILVGSDYHAKQDLLEGTRQELEQGDYDLYINLGDYMEKRYAEDLFEGLDVAALGTTGNRDLHMDDEDLEGLPVYRFLEADIDDEYKLVLIGGDFPENISEKVAEIVEDTPSNRLIIGSHYPPERVGDEITSGRHIGFEQFRRMILRHDPVLWVNGHVHEDHGERELMGTKVINAASHDTGTAYSITINDGEIEEVKEIGLN